jgi:hypothetical protein
MSEDFRAIKEIGKLGHKLDRYRKKLLKEGLKITYRDGIELRILPEREIGLADTRVLNIRVQNGEFNPHPIIELARETLPSLYRKYIEGERKYIDLARKILLS